MWSILAALAGMLFTPWITSFLAQSQAEQPGCPRIQAPETRRMFSAGSPGDRLGKH
jgi:hypothetical protein